METNDSLMSETQAAALALIEAAQTMFPNVHLMVVAMDDNRYCARFSTDCASVAGLMVAGACDAIEQNIDNGVMHAHDPIDAMRALHSDKATTH